MLTYPNINPVAFHLGTLDIHWYGISYLLGFIGAYLVSICRRKKQNKPWDNEQISDLLFYVAVGIIFGGRIGYVLFYQPIAIVENPLTLLTFWVMGRSFHGGLLGVLCAVFIYSKIHKRSFLEVTDFIAPVVPIGLGFGRLGNFINGELWGRVTDLPWAMVFPYAGSQPRHPSQLYEFLLEGVLLFLVLVIYAKRPRRLGNVSALFLILYGVFRFMVEFVREPDLSYGFIAFDLLTMGQLLSLPMVLIGMFLILSSRHCEQQSGEAI